MERALGVVIGLGATYMFLSVVVLAVVEGISNLLSLRASELRACLSRVLSGEGKPAAGSLFDRLWASPLLTSLGAAAGIKSRMPAHIPAPLFVRAFLDTVGELRAEGPELAAAYQQALAALPKHEQEVVRGVVGSTMTSIEDAERRVALWFDGLMSQLSEKYRRRTQRATRITTAVLVLAVNANALTMGATFWRDSVMRAAALQLAQRELALCKLPADPGGTAGTPGAAPAGAASALSTATPSAPSAVATELDCRALLETMGDDVPLPLGWTRAAWTATWQSPASIFAALLGLLLSFVAVCLGAPFWFDVLRRVTPLVRGPAIAAPAASPPGPAPPAPAPAPAGPR